MHEEETTKKELAGILAAIDRPAEMELFLRDLLTPQEFCELATRWQIIKRLVRGSTQRDIAEELNVGIATVTRGSLALQQTAAGFWRVLKKLYPKKVKRYVLSHKHK